MPEWWELICTLFEKMFSYFSASHMNLLIAITSLSFSSHADLTIALVYFSYCWILTASFSFSVAILSGSSLHASLLLCFAHRAVLVQVFYVSACFTSIYSYSYCLNNQRFVSALSTFTPAFIFRLLFDLFGSVRLSPLDSGAGIGRLCMSASRCCEVLNSVFLPAPWRICTVCKALQRLAGAWTGYHCYICTCAEITSEGVLCNLIQVVFCSNFAATGLMRLCSSAHKIRS